VLGTAGGLQFGGIRVNASASLPIGLYRITSNQSAKLIEFCPAEPFGSLSANRAYRGKGNCPDGAEPLMKPIAAVTGDTVELSAAGVTVNDRLLPNSAPLPFDTKRRPLQHWAFGKYRVGSGTVWVISTYNQRSFDSRYFGPIPLPLVRHRLTPFMTE
jgi:conjugative transfer signal peptidase TraF